MKKLVIEKIKKIFKLQSNKITKNNLEQDATHLNSKTKSTYVAPEITSEELVAFGAICNGTSKTGGRKASTGAPSFCQTGKLMS